METGKRRKGKVIGLIFTGIILSVIMLLLYKVGYIPFVGKIIAKHKIENYAKARLGKTDAITVEYDWYNGIYYCSSCSRPALRYQLRNNTIFDGEINDVINLNIRNIYNEITDEFPSNIFFPEYIDVWTTINADDYDVLAQRLYLLEVYNSGNLSKDESQRMPAKIGLEFISYLGNDYNITGIQLIYADRNGMYEIAISPDTFQPLEYEQMLEATKMRTGRELPESYFRWMEENGFNK